MLAATVTVIVSGAQDKPKPDPQKAAAAAPEFKDLDSFRKSLPAATFKPLDPQAAMLFTALPLACLDDLQAEAGAARLLLGGDVSRPSRTTTRSAPSMAVTTGTRPSTPPGRL